MSSSHLRKPLWSVKLKNPLLLKNVFIKVFLNRSWTVLRVYSRANRCFSCRKCTVLLRELIEYSLLGWYRIKEWSKHWARLIWKESKFVMIVTDYLYLCRQIRFVSGFINEVIIHSKYFPGSDWLKAHAYFTITSYWWPNLEEFCV